MAVPSSGQLRLNADINLEINGTGTGTNVSLNGLSSTAGFTAPNGMEEFYGYSAASAPSGVTTNAISGVTVSSMTLSGAVSSDGGATITTRGFYFGTSSNVTSNPQYASGSGTGSFSLSRGVSASTTYYCAAYATNSEGTTVGPTRSATSQAAVPIGNYTSGTVYASGHNGGPMGSNNSVTTSGNWQYNHPNYGFTNIYSYSSHMSGSGYGYGLSDGQHSHSNYYKKRTDNNSVLQHRSYVAATYTASNGNADFTGSGNMGDLSGGCQYGTNSGYTYGTSAAWSSTLQGNPNSANYGGGSVGWNFYGCCYSFYASGYVDTRN